MADIEGLVHALSEGDDEAKKKRVLIVEAGGIAQLVQLLRDGSTESKSAAARALGNLACSDAYEVLIAEAGGIAPLVQLLRDGSADAKAVAAWVLRNLACDDVNQVRIAEARGIPPLVDLVRDGNAWANDEAFSALRNLARHNDANAVAIAAAFSLEALVELTRRGRVTVDERWLARDAGIAAKRKAALVVAALLRDYVPEFKSAPRDIKGLIGTYL